MNQYYRGLRFYDHSSAKFDTSVLDAVISARPMRLTLTNLRGLVHDGKCFALHLALARSHPGLT